MIEEYIQVQCLFIYFYYYNILLFTLICGQCCCRKQSSKLGSVGANVDEFDEESSDDELSYMSNKPSFLKSQPRPKSPSNI